jgi:esterase/lipase superfamily enzyme
MTRSVIGQKAPVEVTFQFPLVVRPLIVLSGRYSASKSMTSLTQPGHYLPLTVTSDFFAFD